MAGWELIDSLDAPSGGVFDFPSLDLSGYAIIQVVLSGVTVSVDDRFVGIRFYVGGTLQTTTYTYGVNNVSTSASSDVHGSVAADTLLFMGTNANWSLGSASTSSLGVTAYVDAPASTTLYKRVWGHAWQIGASGNAISNHFCGHLPATGAIDGIKVIPEAAGGTAISAGKMRIYGMAA